MKSAMWLSHSLGAVQLLSEPTSRLGWTRTAVALVGDLRGGSDTPLQTIAIPIPTHRHNAMPRNPCSRSLTSFIHAAAQSAFRATTAKLIPYTPVHGASGVIQPLSTCE